MNFLIQLVVMLVASYIASALGPKPPKPKPASLSDFDVPTAEEGRAVPVIFGTVWVTGPNVIWYGDLDIDPIKSKGGKKG